MLFNSAIFFLFLAIVLPVYYALSRRAQNLWLLVASYVFYGYWDWRFLSLLAISTVVDYVCGLKIESAPETRVRKRFLLLSVAANLGILGFFKYFNFFTGSAEALLDAFGLKPSFPLLQIVLPVGISFYTFQTMSYTIDIYRGKMRPTRDFLTFALYVSYFPQLVAGPIERASRLLPQLLARAGHLADVDSRGTDGVGYL
jgi:D-alanyl-lipoteichoic acid acyltransferase DltB (MBOAT superfamily)